MPALLDMNTTPAEPEEAADRKQAMRFQYPSGSRPLEGYTIKRGVGRGGFGEVYFAVSDAGKEVALKLIRRNLEVELRGVTHCLNLKHPNLIDIYDIRTDEHDDRWVVMEYVNGASLEDVIERHPNGMPRDMALHWFEGLCAGVGYLHDHGIVHRDLKPANVFLDDGRVKIGDYGLSKFISCSRRSGQTESVGTVHYMAPEIANGRYGREIDSYALGIILYEMITGSVPFVGESIGEVLMKHLTAEPDLSKLEEPYRGVIRAAMAKDPERRIDNVGEMMAMLRGVPRSPVSAEAAAGVGPTVITDFAPAWSPQPSPGPRPTSPPAAPPRGFDAIREFIHREPEPVWTAVTDGFRLLRKGVGYDTWKDSHRGLLLVGLFIGMILMWPAILGVSFVMAVWYGLYRLVRLIGQVMVQPPDSLAYRDYASGGRPSPPPRAAGFYGAGAGEGLRPIFDDEPARPTPVPTPTPAPVVTKRGRRRQGTWRHAAYAELAARPLRDRATSLLASMLAAAAIAPVAAVFACLFLAPQFNVELFLWVAIVGTLSSWAVMIPAQLTEGRIEEHTPLRFSMLLAGALVGVLAFGVAQLLYLDLPVGGDFGFSPKESLSSEMFGYSEEVYLGFHQRGAVALPVRDFAVYFAALFVVMRWWRLAEWTRSTRVSMWAIAWACGIGFAASLLMWFPQPLGIIMAGVIAFTVQLASPWLSPSRRREMAQAAVAA
jgi:hypothetical protein